MTQLKPQEKPTRIWDSVKIMLAVTPAISLALSCLYYFIFLSHFDGIGLNILSLNDYLDKSVEFIPLVAILTMTLLFNLFLYPPRLENESEEQHYSRIGGSKSIWKWSNIATAISFVIGFLYMGATLIPVITFIFYMVFLLSCALFGNIILAIAKHTPKDWAIKFFTRSRIYLSLGFFMLLMQVVINSFGDAQKVKTNLSADTIRLVDVIDAGYLKLYGETLVLEDKNGSAITTIKLTPFDDRSLLCKFSFEFACKLSTFEEVKDADAI